MQARASGGWGLRPQTPSSVRDVSEPTYVSGEVMVPVGGNP